MAVALRSVSTCRSGGAVPARVSVRNAVTLTLMLPCSLPVLRRPLWVALPRPVSRGAHPPAGPLRPQGAGAPWLPPHPGYPAASPAALWWGALGLRARSAWRQASACASLRCGDRDPRPTATVWPGFTPSAFPPCHPSARNLGNAGHPREDLMGGNTSAGNQKSGSSCASPCWGVGSSSCPAPSLAMDSGVSSTSTRM